MLMLTSAGFLAAAPPPPPGDYLQIGGSMGVDFRCPVAAPGTLPYTINVTPPKPTEPRTFINIGCTIRLYAPHAATAAQNRLIEAFQQYIKYNIEAVWNSSSNALISPQYVVTCSINVVRVYLNTGDLPAGDLFMVVKTGAGRSFSDRPKHAAAFFIDAALQSGLMAVFNATIRRITPLGFSPTVSAATQARLCTLTPTTPNVPAHEFGHILGLSDRYAYLAYVLREAGVPPEVITDRAHIVPLYVDAARDPEYGTNFQWLFNLMSTQLSPVPAAPTGLRPIPWTGDAERRAAISVQDTLRYRQIYPAVTPLPAPVPGRVDIYLTAAQLAVIASEGLEALPGATKIYFKNVHRVNYLSNKTMSFGGETFKYKDNCIFRGTFIGPIATASGNTVHVVHDDHYDVNRNTSETPDGFCLEANDRPSQFLLVEVDKNTTTDPDATMGMRCYRIDTNANKGTKNGLAPGFVDGMLDIDQLAAEFNEQSELDAVPLNLAGLLDVEHLDRRVAIRRFVADDIQGRLHSNGDLWFANGGKAIRKIVSARLGDIKIDEAVLTVPEDLFADLPDLCSGGTSVFVQGLFVPYMQWDKNNQRRKGKTWFYTGAQPAGDGAKIPITDSFTLRPETAADAGERGIICGPVVNDVRDIWNFNERQPPTSGPTMVMDYDARIYTNRIKLIALVNNGRLESIGTANDPATYSLQKCFVLSDFPGPTGGPTTADFTPPNANPRGRYLGLQYLVL